MQHLYICTLRVDECLFSHAQHCCMFVNTCSFVGPLPVGWLENHRADWYKQHFYYSKQQSSFSAQPNTISKRGVTGLEAPSGNVREEDGDENNAEQEPTSEPVPIPSLGRSYSSTPTITPTRRKEKGREEATPPPSSLQSKISRTPPTPSRLRPKTADTNTSLATARTRPKTTESLLTPAWLNRGESYATAHETWEHANEYRAKGRTGRVERNEVPPIPAIPTDVGFGESMTTDHSQGGASTVSAPHTIRAQDSLASLLKRDQDRRRLSDSVDSRLMNLDGHVDSIYSGEPSRRSSVLSLRWKSKSRMIKKPMEEVNPTPWNSRISSHQERVAGGLVRFNTTDMSVQERDNEMQKQITDLNRARSLRHGGRRRSSLMRQHSGEIIKMDSMIVRIEIAHAQQLPEDYDENASLKVNTRTADKWREYVVVCRERDDPDIPMILRLYKSRTIPAIDKQHISSRSTREIPLNPKTTNVNLYSSLDKTLVIWLPYKHGTLIYIMRPRCSSSSVEWYAFLRTALGEQQCKSLQISVPDLALTISINNPFERRDYTQVNESGDITAIEQQDVAGNLLKRSMEMLKDVDEWEDILEHWGTNERMGLAWRRYDRLEWVHGTNEQRMDGSMAMQKTHELELRPKTHYPTESVLVSGEKMVEPPPVEGFLVRLTSGKGKERLGRYFNNRLYYACHDQFLCFCRPSRALPPPPPKPLARGGVVPTPSEISEGMPLVYCISPFLLNQDGEIEWLANPTLGPVEKRDQEAYEEAERKVNLLLRAEGFVDLTQAAGVRRVRPKRSDGPVADADGCMEEHSGEQSSVVEVDDEMCFEIVLENGLILKLQV